MSHLDERLTDSCKALALFQMCMKIDQDNYPESLQKMYMVNAPAIFTVVRLFSPSYLVDILLRYGAS